jgi:amidase
MQDLALQPATALAALIHERKLSSRELLDIYLQRIARHNPALNAVITLDEERARKLAFDADEELITRGPRGLLHGLPLTIKDAYETAGMRTTSGAPAWAQHVPASNAVTVQRLIDAGAYVIGKTNVPAYCADVQSYNDIFGTTNNPHDLARTPGGSSGGAAVSVACGFTALELGSDIGGSIRTPCHWTGIYGHKPSWDLVPQRGHIPPAPGVYVEEDLSVCGPMARSAGDLALALSVLAGPDRAKAKAYRLELPKPRALALRELRVGAWLDDDALPVDHEVLAVLDGAVRAIEASGARVDRNARFDRPLVDVVADYQALLNPVIAAAFPAALLDQLHAIGKDDPSHALAHFGRTATARHTDWLRIHARRERDRVLWERFFERYDVLVCPVSGTAAIPHQVEGSAVTRTITINGEARPYIELMGWISLATAAYLPATVVPVGRTASGLPVGLQIIGPYLEDLTTIAAAERIGELTQGFEPPRMLTLGLPS